MKFIVRRTSELGEDIQPCEGAKKEIIKYPKYVNRDEGDEAVQGHYETVAEYPNGGKDVKWVADAPAVEKQAPIIEYENYEEYCIEINSLQELAEFIKENGRIVIDTGSTDYLTIEIYDTWRE